MRKTTTDLIEKIKSSEIFNFDETFNIYNICSKTIFENEDEGRAILIYILDNRKKFDTFLDDMLSDIIESVGFYPYLEKEGLHATSTAAEIRKNMNESSGVDKKYYHDAQKKIIDLIFQGNNIVVSAPTSFGKSLLIEDIVASNRYKNLLIIQPTLALLDETRKNLSKYKDIYKLIIKTSQEPSDTNNIFLFTAERAIEYPYFTSIDFLVIDEFYKLSAKRDDGRSASINNAFLKAIYSYNCQFYLLGPNIEGISEGFASKYNAKFIKLTDSLVLCEEHNIYKEYKKKDFNRIAKRENILFELLAIKLKNKNSLVYCSSPRKAKKLALKYMDYIRKNDVYKKENNDISIIEWIKKHVSEEWSFTNLIKFGIGVHDGTLPRHISSTMIDLFNSGKINTIFCTTTIIEGVNTNTENIIYFNKKKGKNDIDFFDYSNMKGRAGRLMSHYIGNIFNFEEPPAAEKVVVDIPFFEQNPIQDEVLINLRESDIKDPNNPSIKLINELSTKEKELLAKNNINIKGQINLLKELKKLILNNEYSLLIWDIYPSYEQLNFCLNLCLKFLRDDKYDHLEVSSKQFIYLTNLYGKKRDLYPLITNTVEYLKRAKENEFPTDQERWDEAIQKIFKFFRSFLQFKIPKWLKVLHSLQEFVAKEMGITPGNYLFYATSLENDFLPQNLSILIDYGIPSTAIRKISTVVPNELTQDEALNFIRSNKIFLDSKVDLLKYERDKFLQNL